MSIRNVLTDDQLLRMALDIVSFETEDDTGLLDSDTYEAAGEIVCYAAIKNLDSPTEDEVEAEYNMMILTHVLDKLARKGDLEEEVEREFLPNERWEVIE